MPVYAPPPLLAKLSINVQPISVLEQAPPPELAVLSARMQLLSVPPNAPPPEDAAELPISTQLLTTAEGEAHHTPPPLCSSVKFPAARVAPLVSVKPTNASPLVR